MLYLSLNSCRFISPEKAMVSLISAWLSFSGNQKKVYFYGVEFLLVIRVSVVRYPWIFDLCFFYQTCATLKEEWMFN